MIHVRACSFCFRSRSLWNCRQWITHYCTSTTSKPPCTRMAEPRHPPPPSHSVTTAAPRRTSSSTTCLRQWRKKKSRPSSPVLARLRAANSSVTNPQVRKVSDLSLFVFFRLLISESIYFSVMNRYTQDSLIHTVLVFIIIGNFIHAQFVPVLYCKCLPIPYVTILSLEVLSSNVMLHICHKIVDLFKCCCLCFVGEH